MLRLEKYLFYFAVLLALSIIIIPKYYITGDGASHVYNAKVLFDMVSGQSQEFYEQFYKVNRHIDPNWSSHIIIGFFTRMFPPWLADKLFQILYVLTFCFGFRYLIRSIKKENAFLSFLFFPFLFTLPFQQGFYNYCFSLAILFWAVGFYIRYEEKLNNPLVQLGSSMLVLGVALAHGMPAIYTMMIISAIWLVQNWQKVRQLKIDFIVTGIARLAVIFLPTLLLIAMFIAKRGFGSTPHPKTYLEKFVDFVTMWTSQSTRNVEVIPAVMSLVLILVFCVLIFVKKERTSFRFNREDGKIKNLSYVFLIFAGFTFFSYMTAPDTIGGAGSVEIRLAFLPPMFLILFLATKTWQSLYQGFFILASFVISVFFLVLRFPSVMQANTVAKEIMTGAEHIKDESVVLNLHYDDWQITDNGDSIFQKDNSFLHFTDHYGSLKNKHLVLLMNYEADINYFPVNWAENKNPRKTINNMYAGTYPPCADFTAYEKQAGKKIDYILLQNWREEFAKAKCTQDLLMQMQAEGFTKKYESPNAYIVVWGR